MGARAVVGPRRGVQAVADGDRHQLVVGGVVFDLVDAVAVAVVGVQDRLVAVGQFAPALRLRAARQRAEFGDLVEAPLPPSRISASVSTGEDAGLWSSSGGT